MGDIAAGRTPDVLASALVDNVRDYAIFVLDADGCIQTWNAGAQQIKGYRADEVIGRHFSLFYSVEDRARGYPDAELAAATAMGRYEDEGWRVRKSGERFWANVVITALRDPTGKLMGFGKVTRDLTERRQAELARVREAARFRAVFDHAPTGLAVMNPDGRFVEVNQALCRMLGRDELQLVGEHAGIVVHTEDVGMLCDQHSRLLAGEDEGIATEFPLRPRRGVSRHGGGTHGRPEGRARGHGRAGEPRP